MDIRTITVDDYRLLDSAGGYLRQYGRNVQSWIDKGFIDKEGCFVFAAGGAVIGGVCFTDDTPRNRIILDFALTNAEIPNGAPVLRKAIFLAANADTKTISYDLYNDTEQYEDILNLFLQAGFFVSQAKKSYRYEQPEPPQAIAALTFRSVAEVGEEMFINTFKEATFGTLDKLMADDVARLGGDRAARVYVDSVKSLDYHADWWMLGYYRDELVGMVLPQRFDDSIGVINYIGVLPRYRGHGYGAMLITEGTRLLYQNGIKKIIADIDVANAPMAAALERVGYVIRLTESVLSYRMGT